MKFIQTLIALLIIQFSFSQWRFNEGGNGFDGKYKAALIIGNGTDYPYDDPFLAVSKYEDGTENFIIGDAGYWQEDTGISIKFYFDDSDVIYSVYDWGYSRDGKNLYLRSFNDPLNEGQKLSNYEIIDLLRKYSKVRFRISNRYGSNDLTFSLSGSSAAINKVYPDLSLAVSLDKKARVAMKEMAANAEKLRDSLLEELKKEMLTSTSLERVKIRLDQDMNIGMYEGMGTPEYPKDIIIRPKNYTNQFGGDVEVFIVYEDDTEAKIFGSFVVQKGAPIYQRLESLKKADEARTKEAIANLGDMYQKFKIPRLIKAVRDYVIKKSDLSYPKWEVEDVMDIKATINRPFGEKIMDVKLVLIIKGEGPKRIVVRVSDLDIKLPEITEIGLEPLIEF